MNGPFGKRQIEDGSKAFLEQQRVKGAGRDTSGLTPGAKGEIKNAMSTRIKKAEILLIGAGTLILTTCLVLGGAALYSEIGPNSNPTLTPTPTFTPSPTATEVPTPTSTPSPDKVVGDLVDNSAEVLACIIMAGVVVGGGVYLYKNRNQASSQEKPE